MILGKQSLEDMIHDAEWRIGKRVTVTFPHYGRIQRVLCQDWQGLYVKYKGHRVSVRSDTTAMGEILPGYYIGLHPKLMK